jgi:glycosyltransferase involved in cell wall biosynthesis
MWTSSTLPHWPSSAPPRQVLCRWPRRLLEFGWRWFEAPTVERLVGRVDVFHSVHLNIPPRRRARRVLTVHDLREFHLPALYGWLQEGRARRALAARQADHVIVVSEATRRDVIDLFEVPADRVTVAHNGVDASFYRAIDDATVSELRRRLGLERPFILTLSSKDPRKDVGSTVKAARHLREQYRWDGDLVVAGALPDGFETSAGVRCVGLVSDRDLPVLMRAAEALLIASRYEGFGLPAVESMAVGTPVVACNTSSLPEVVGDAGILVAAGDAEAMAAALHTLLTQPSTRQSLVAAGAVQARKFTWEQHAATVAAVYRSLSG